MLLKSTFLKLSSIILMSLVLSRSEENITGSNKTYERGDIIESNNLNTYSVTEIKLLFSITGYTEDLELTHSVKVVNIIYQSADINDNPIELSGALMIPQTNISSPILSIQHGTETKSQFVASVNPINSVEGISGLITGSIGYVTCIPDYAGFGKSDQLHPYMHARSLAISVVDFITAAKTYCNENNININEQLFLAGYSEGGFATLATQKEIEKNYSSQLNITAVSPMAGPYDLLGTADYILNQTEYPWPAYIAFLFTAYNDIYGWDRLDDMFVSPYAGMMEQLFDGSNSFFDINDALPKSQSQLFKSDFISGIINRTDETFISALAENSLLDWSPIAPIRFFHGDADITSPYQNVITARDSLLANGASQIEVITIPGGTHASASLPSLLGMIDWFESFRLVL